ncbi:MAG: aromatic ring-hydroxylating oxygenase subunit alpha [Pseudomonadota bacterium]
MAASKTLATTGLPGWVYRDQAFFAAERERIFKRAWQVACHVSDVPEPGDYFRLDFMDEPLIIVRGEDGVVRALANVCRHRGARLLDGEGGGPRGQLRSGRIVCPFHAWTYDGRGRLVAVPRQSAYPGLTTAERGLPELEVETWQGFVFFRLEPGGPSVQQMMRPYEAELRPYRLGEMRPLGRVTLRPREVNWKTVVENYIDGLHIAHAHTGLGRLIARSYALEVKDHVYRMSGAIEARENAGWSERHYCAILPSQAHLPEDRRRLWSYYLLWPNVAFDVYPDQVDFMHIIPLAPGRTLIREIPYALPDSSREMRLARYLNWRINRVVSVEDRDLIERVYHGTGSRGYVRGPLSEEEICIAAFADRLRRILPECDLAEPPRRV